MRHAYTRFFLLCWGISYTLIALLLSVTSLVRIGPDRMGADEYLLLQLMCAIIAAWVTLLRRLSVPVGRVSLMGFWVLAYLGCIGTVFGLGLAFGWFVPSELPGVGLSATAVFAGTGGSLWVREMREERNINARLARLRGQEEDK